MTSLMNVTGYYFQKSVDISIEMTVDMKTFIKRNILKSILSDFFFFPLIMIRCPLLKCKEVAYLAKLQPVTITHQTLLPFHNTF